jgi:phosphoglycolate phosphatase-like HAD superfamily hydrolase
MATPDPLPGWSDGETKQAIISFVRQITTAGDGYVAPSERIAAFDNDGTLWCEKPMYVQADFVFRKWRAMATADESLLDRQPYKAVVEGDREWLASAYDHVVELLAGVGDAFSGITTNDFEAQVADFFRTASHPTLGLPYTQLAYRPMRELLKYLQANEFRVFICSGGGRDFVRVVSEDLYGIPREQVIGSSALVEYRGGELLRTAGFEQPLDDGPGKPVHIWARTGRRPLLAGGNADGDIDMLSQARFALLVRHDDAEREFAYDTGSENALELAKRRDWTVASMASDFLTVF